MLDIILLLAIGIFGTYILKFQKKLMPTKYFYFSRLIDGIEEDISFLGAIVRTFIPLIFGFIIATVAIKLDLPHSELEYGALEGFLIIFLLIWPDLLNPKFRTPYIKKNTGKLYLLYFILMLAFTTLGAIGGQIGKVIFEFYPNLKEFIDIKIIINSLAVTFIWSSFALIIKLLANSFQESTQ